jgi:LmbE family N-acetylglucosaminyl deacetylase
MGGEVLDFKFAPAKDRPLRILFLGAHSDDIEIGCGGTVLRLTEDYEYVDCTWVVFSSSPIRKREAEESARAFLANSKKKKIVVKNFKDGFFPYDGSKIKESFEALKRIPPPDLIFTHYRLDLHQDHRLISELTWNTFRDHLILEYEIPKYDGDLGCPNFYVNLKKSTCHDKIGYLLEYFKSQGTKHWFSRETFQALMRLRGMECNAPGKYAEAYYCRKIIF